MKRMEGMRWGGERNDQIWTTHTSGAPHLAAQQVTNLIRRQLVHQKVMRHEYVSSKYGT
jgi:hypothetical protein